MSQVSGVGVAWFSIGLGVEGSGFTADSWPKAGNIACGLTEAGAAPAKAPPIRAG